MSVGGPGQIHQTDMRITVTLPHLRALPGRLNLNDFECICLGKADNDAASAHGNPSRDPTRAFGDTPCGTYGIAVGTVEQPEHAYGPHPVIHIVPLTGDGIERARNERMQPYQLGLLIHSGPLNAAGQLRPTHGCLRVHDDDQAKLVEMLAGQQATLEVIEETAQQKRAA